MAATALIKFTQGSTVGGDGEALLGVVGTSVHVSNVDNAGILSWQVDLLDVDPASTLVPANAFAFSNSTGTPSADFVPDVRGSYRLALRVWDVANRAGDPIDVDIRVFSVPEPHGLVVPPSQLWPLPKPAVQSGEDTAKPNEMNYGGQARGWAGNGSSDGLVSSLIRKVDAMQGVITRNVLHVQAEETVPFALQDGSVLRPFSTLQAAFDHINVQTDPTLVAWQVILTPGFHTCGTLWLQPGSSGLSSFRIELVGAASGLTYLDTTAMNFRMIGEAGLCVFSLHNVQLSGPVILYPHATASVHPILVECLDSSIPEINADELTGDTLEVFVKGTALGVEVGTFDYHTSSTLGSISATTCAASAYIQGVVTGLIDVAGPVVLQGVVFDEGAEGVSAHSIDLRQCRFAEESTLTTGYLHTVASPHRIGMDNGTFSSALKNLIRFSAASTIYNLDGGEFSVEYPVRNTTTDVADQVVFDQDVQYLPSDVVISARAVVTTFNPNTVLDYGHLHRYALFTAAGMVKEGEVLLAGGPVVDMSTGQSVRFMLQGTSIVLLCTPNSYTDDLNHSWKAVVYYSIHKA